ncbi:MAG: hypothetical protein ACFE96_10125 [Candidatus Hermodarchaeota archaeon]
MFEIKNKIYLQTDLSKYLEKEKTIPEKLVYDLNLSPPVFQSMIEIVLKGNEVLSLYLLVFNKRF